MQPNEELKRTAQPERLVLALTLVSGATGAIRSHGDVATLEVARAANALVRAAVDGAHGRVIKSLGEGLLMAFPANSAREAVAALQAVREKAGAVWRAFDPGCDMHVKVTVGSVLVGDLGLLSEPTPDVWGLAVHDLFKDRGTGLVLLPDLQALLEVPPNAV
ncbi:MAG: hypothetical protein WD801_16485 [Gemmatimonadaceae bacterium]